MIRQTTFNLSAKRRGCHLVTQEILEHLPKPLPQFGMLNLFVQHTSCALSINENYDPDVRTDMEAILNHMVKEREPYHSYNQRPSEYGHMAGYISLRVQKLRRIAQNRCHHLRIGYGNHTVIGIHSASAAS
jgi:secondary thiamine-phosphate synthase enzyme